MMAASEPLSNSSCWVDESVMTGRFTVVKYGLGPQYFEKARSWYSEPTLAWVSMYGPLPRSWVRR